ncbi:hypothetical protein [Gimesia algae]|uniref:Uncharacterized protein n=1 Tax=Gimesia algae TaxID=2527971 RepID=A0A517VEN0_9PLAN|nr:hypothetical protein [Gimesia algae]QDT91468.1 hypothetical protein Pan161_31260 [Gimesia algae]
MHRERYSVAQLAELLGVSPVCVEAYVALVVLGSLKKQQVNDVLGVPTYVCDQALATLRKRNFITKGLLTYRTVPYTQLDRLTDRQRRAFGYIAGFRRKDNVHDGVGMMQYEGYEGIQRVYLEVLDEAIANDESILAFESGLDAESVGDEFMQAYIEKRIAAKVPAFVLSPNEEQDQAYKAHYEGNLTHVQLVDGLALEANVNVVGSLVMTYTLNPARGTIRRDQGEAETLKCVFWKLWEHEKRIAERDSR